MVEEFNALVKRSNMLKRFGKFVSSGKWLLAMFGPLYAPCQDILVIGPLQG